MTEISRPAGELRNFKLTVEYEGSAYHGWQSQRDRPSVQSTLEQAIRKVVQHQVVLYGSGRTDRGVHALGQTASFRTTMDIAAPKLLLAINTYLPEDIRVREVEEVDLAFHARYSAVGKQYRYVILRMRRPLGGRADGAAGGTAARPPETAPAPRSPSVLVRRFSTEVPYELDVEAMRRGAALLPGMRDFRAFESYSKRRPPRPGDSPRSTVRTVLGVMVREIGPFVLIDAFGRGFLYSMVRTIAGTLIEIGKGARAPERLQEILDSRDRRRAGFTAPAEGLLLVAVYYEEKALAAAMRELRGEPAASHASMSRFEEGLLKILS